MSLPKRIGWYVMGAFYAFAGINHFVSPDFYMQIMPPYLGAHRELVELSGVAEFALGLVAGVLRAASLFRCLPNAARRTACAKAKRFWERSSAIRRCLCSSCHPPRARRFWLATPDVQAFVFRESSVSAFFVRHP